MLKLLKKKKALSTHVPTSVPPTPPNLIPVVWVGQLSWFGKVMEAVHARTGLGHGFAVKATAIKVGQLLPVVLLILIWVIVIGTHYIIQGFSVGLLWLRSPADKTAGNK